MTANAGRSSLCPAFFADENRKKFGTGWGGNHGVDDCSSAREHG